MQIIRTAAFCRRLCRHRRRPSPSGGGGDPLSDPIADDGAPSRCLADDASENRGASGSISDSSDRRSPIAAVACVLASVAIVGRGGPPRLVVVASSFAPSRPYDDGGGGDDDDEGDDEGDRRFH